MPHNKTTTSSREADRRREVGNPSTSGQGGSWYAERHGTNPGSKSPEQVVAAAIGRLAFSQPSMEQLGQPASDDLVASKAKKAFPEHVIDQARSDALMRLRNIENLTNDQPTIDEYRQISDNLHIIHTFVNYHYSDNLKVKAAMLRIKKYDKNSRICQSESIRAIVDLINENPDIQAFLPPTDMQEMYPRRAKRSRSHRQPIEGAPTRDSGRATEQNIDSIMEKLNYKELGYVHGNIKAVLRPSTKAATETKRSAKIVAEAFETLIKQKDILINNRILYDRKTAIEACNCLEHHYYNGRPNDTVKGWYQRAGFDYAQDTPAAGSPHFPPDSPLVVAQQVTTGDQGPEIPQAPESQATPPVAGPSLQRDTHSDPPLEVTSIRDSGEATEQNIDNIMRGLNHDALHKFKKKFSNKSHHTKNSIMIIKNDFINFELILSEFHRNNKIYDKKFAADCYNSIKKHYYYSKLNDMVKEQYTQIGFDYAQ